ncbi:MAG TPA: hypothetical protein ENK80_04690 [Rhodobacterales bacterium]|nr:hypothetical protein [Rhodobacterales bacterium]
MSQNLRDLEALATIVFDAEMAHLNVLSNDLSAWRAQIERLAAERAARSAALDGAGGEPDLAFLFGQDARWAGWIHQERQRLAKEVANAAARREEQVLKTQRAFGKRDALRRLREREEAARNRMQARRTVP